MTSFVLIPGAGGVAWYWHRVVPLLEAAGHEAIAVDLPGDDEHAGLSTYADRVVQAIGGRRPILVAQSLGGFTAPLVCERVPVEQLVFVNAMIPVPGETAGAWWENTGATQARLESARRAGYTEELDIPTYFLHDVPAEVLKGGEAHQRPEAVSSSVSLVAFRAGLMFRFGSSPDGTTDSFRLSFSGGWRGNG